MRVHVTTGRVAHGIAGDGVYVDGVPLAAGGGLNGMPDWWGDRVIWPSKQYGAVVVAAPGDPAPPTRVTDEANLVRAGLIDWAAWSPARGVWTSWGLSLPRAVLLDMSWDGTLLVGDYYHHEEGVGVSAYLPGAQSVDDRHWHEPTARASSFLPYPQASIVTADIAVWTEPEGRYGRALRAHGLPPLTLPWSVLHPTACMFYGDVWVTYLRPDDTIVCHPWDFTGRGLIASGTGFGPVGSAWIDRIDLRWSRRAGEVGDDIVLESRDPGTIDVLPPVHAPVEPPQPPEEPPAPAEPLAISITDYRATGRVPMALWADYAVTGHAGQPVAVSLTLDGARVAGTNDPAGRLEVELHEPGEYRLGATVRCGDRIAKTGAVRIVRVLAAPPADPPVIPPEVPVSESKLTTAKNDAINAAIVDAYRELLEREPDPFGIDYYGSRLSDGRLTIAGMRADIEASDEYRAKHQTPTPPADTAVPTPRTGVVRADGAVFVDDGGPWLPLGTSLFWALWGELYDPDRLDRNLAFAASHGVEYVRILAMVGAASWEDRRIDPHGSGYWDNVAALFARLRRHGLRAKVTVFADAQVMMPDRGDRDAFVDAWANFANAHAEQILLIELANEHWQNGFAYDRAQLRALTERMAHRTACLVAASAPMGDWPEGDEAEFDAHQREVAEDWRQLYGGDVCDVVTIHPDRDISKADGPWRPVRQPWFLQFTPDIPELVEIGEPIGPQSSVAEDDDPLRLTMAAAVGALCGAGAYCLHTGAGIRGGGAFDVAKGRSANLWEVPHIEATLAGLRAVRALLPSDLPNWERHNWHWPGHPLKVAEAEIDHLIRFFAATKGNRAVILPIGVRQTFTAVAQWDMTITEHDPLTGQSIGVPLPLQKGWATTFTREASVVLAEW